MRSIKAASLALVLLVAGATLTAEDSKRKGESVQHAPAVTAARDKGLGWLTKNQAKDGSWGKTYPIAATSFACLAYLSAGAEPFEGDHGRALVKGLQFLLASQDKGMFNQNGHSWIHGQGFGTLALCESYGRTLFCKTKPDLDVKKVRAAVEAVASLGLIQKFDFQVMINGFNFLQKITPAAISKERFPYYGHFYGSMGMHLLYQEYKGDKQFETKTLGYIRDAQKDLLTWQQ